MIRAMIYSLFLIISGIFSSTPTNAYYLTAHDFKFNDINGNELNLKEYKGKVILMVNVASRCGFTRQYEGLQAIWDQYKDKDFILLGVPSNDFYQELSTEEEVKNFCDLTFGVNFPMTKITPVRGKDAHPFYKWAKSTYGTKTVPKWNFYKLLIDKDGKVVETYSSMTSPTDNKLISKIESLINS